MIALPVLVVAGVMLAPARQPERQIGVVTAIDAASRQFVLALDGGGEQRVTAGTGASVVRIAPGEKDLARATAIVIGDIGPGDRVMVRGTVDAAGVLEARSIVVISKADLARKHDADRAQWKSRGIYGKVLAVEPATKELTVALPDATQTQPLRLRLAANATERRYLPGSARFSDAAASTIGQIKVGDQIHALGEKSPDGALFTAQEVVSGTFRNFAAVVNSIDPDHQIVTVRDLERKRTVEVRIGPDSALRKITPASAQRLTARNAATDARAVLEQLPATSLGELKSGDAVIISTSDEAAESARSALTVITLLSGAEPLLAQSASAQRSLLGAWNLNLDPNQP